MSNPFADDLHEILLRVAGWLPDDMLTSARVLLADDRCGEVARLLVFAGRRTVLPLTEDNLDVLTELLESEGADVSSLALVELAADNASLLWRFSAERDEPAEGEQDDETGHAILISALAEQDLLAAVAEEPGLRGLWSAVRTPVDGAPYPPARVVYVAEVDDEHEDAGSPAEITGRLQATLLAAGERDPQLEVVSIHRGKPAYQYAAQTRGKVLWAAEPELEVKVARVFDKVDPEAGPSFAPDRPKIEQQEERDRILDYLETGTRLLVTAARLQDVVQPDRGAAVPTNFYTDGKWVWTDSISYYLEQYHLAPDPELLEHIDAVDGPPPRPDTIALGRAMEALTPSEEKQPVWTSS
ncbi:hypothetical protein [Amycolatopsis thailandensis]|uniref:hypothetical protein n=1 Tax=Amycolatopsis thailandensis TaxID=589330 RepID=UPI0036451297